MLRDSRLWLGLVLVLLVSDGSSSGKQERDELRDTSGVTSNFSFRSWPPQSGGQIKLRNALSEENPAQKRFTVNAKKKLLLEASSRMDHLNMTRDAPTYKVNLNALRLSGQNQNLGSLEYLFNNWWLPSSSPNMTQDEVEYYGSFAPGDFSHEFNHRQFITETMLSISRMLEKVGVTNTCSMPSAENFRQSATEFVDHIFLNKSSKQQTPWIDKNHPVGKNVRKLSGSPENEQTCRSSFNDAFLKSHFEQLVSQIDNDLMEFLFKRLAPVSDYLTTFGRSVESRILPILHHVCVYTFGTKGLSVEQCKNDLTDLFTKIVAEKSKDSLSTFKMVRQKRSAGTEDINERMLASESSLPQATIQDIEKSGSYGGGGGYGGGGYGEGGYGGYDDPNIIVIPDEGNDFSYPLILKFLGILVIGTYVFLGLLVAHTLLSLLLFGFGPAGEKGDSGYQGPQGMQGVKGMKGMKGMKGVDGPLGKAGNAGMDGDKGLNGDTGDTGPIGPMGPDGDKGEKGNKGVKASKGAKGNPGPAGSQGEKGNQGPKGDTGRRKRATTRLLEPPVSVSDILDAPDLLRVLYQKRNRIETQKRTQDAHSIISTINDIWREYKNPVGCLRCALFDFLCTQPIDSLDSYVAAGFAHVLGDTESVQMLDSVRRARKKNVSIRCRRWRSSCKLEYIDDK